MALPDKGIKKVIIPKSFLPQRSGKNKNYALRFRVVSEDKNRSSHWSIKYNVDLPDVTTIDYRIAIDASHDMINVVWVPEANTKPEFDIYIKWNDEPWEFVSTVFTTTYSTIIKNGANTVQVAVQVPTFPKQRYTGSTLFESTPESI